MAFLGRGKKDDLKLIAVELGESVNPDDRIIDLKNLIINSENYDEDFVKELLSTVIADRTVREERERETVREEREYELERLKLEIASRNFVNISETQEGDSNRVRVDLQKLVPKFDPKEDDICMFLVLFERQMKLFKISEELWVS